MEGATFLTRVVLENYRSIAHCDVRLGPLTYLVGRGEVANFIEQKRAEGLGIDAKLLLLLNF